jgi:predicted AlkP superfamily pyrophosphatase or phosphodiesterase
MKLAIRLSAGLVALGIATGVAHANQTIEHVLLISVDGLHASDLSRYVTGHPQSALAKLSSHGLTYSKAMTSFPSDSFPGLLSFVTGGSPRTTGVWYDAAFGHDLAEAKDCKPGMKSEGAEYDYSEELDVKNGSVFTTIDPSKLVVNPKTCKPIYPHSLLRVNTVFEVIKNSGHRTAWSDKHPAYDLINGPSGKGVDDLFVPEITVLDGEDATSSVEKVIAYDGTKVQAVINELKGLDSAGKAKVGVPALLGMNFQAVSVGQKLKGNGYVNANSEPSEGLAKALDAVDASLAQMSATLDAEKLTASTLVIVSAKHGQSPIDPAKRRIVDSKALKATLNSVGKDIVSSVTTDDIALLWLSDKSKTANIVKALEAQKSALAIGSIVSGAALVKDYADPAKDPRAPDIIIQPEVGVIYTKPTASKLAEHGGGTDDDRHVALLVSNPALASKIVDDAVATTQVAPSILKALGIKPNLLSAVKAEKTPLLPQLFDAMAMPK